MLLVILNDEQIIGTFYEKELQAANQLKFRVEKVNKRKDDKLFSKDINVNVNLSNYGTKTDLKNINLDYFRGKSYFDEDGAQNYLVF